MLWYCLGNKHAALLWGNCAAACQPSPWLLHLNYGAAENQWTVSMYFTLCLPLFSSLIKPVISFLTTQFWCIQLEVTTALQLQSIGQGNEICIFSLSNTKAVKDLKIWYSTSVLVCHRKETASTPRCALLNFMYTEFYREKKPCPLCWVFNCRSVALWRNSFLPLLTCSN